MNHLQATAIVLALGGGIAGFGLLHPNPSHGPELWLGLAGVYLLAGVLLGGARFVRENLPAPFTYASVVAILAVLIAIGFRTWSVLVARPNLALAETTFVLWQFHVLVPFVMSGMVPLGTAESRGKRILVASVLSIPFFAATGRGLLYDFGFGPMFVVVYYGLILVVGLLAGFPLYLYARRFRSGFSVGKMSNQ